jgi:hypothetical protein
MARHCWSALRMAETSRREGFRILGAALLLLAASCREPARTRAASSLAVSEMSVRNGEESYFVAGGVRFTIAPAVRLTVRTLRTLEDSTPRSSTEVTIDERPLMFEHGVLRVGLDDYGELRPGQVVRFEPGRILVDGQPRLPRSGC